MQANGAPLIDPATGQPTPAYRDAADAELRARRDRAALGLSGQPIRTLVAALIVAIGRRIARAGAGT